MKRRDVLKGIGLSLGYVVATPTVISLLKSCKKADVTNWTPVFFTKNQMEVMSKLVDLILPKTSDLPGALDVKVPQFLDAYVNEVSNSDEQNKIKLGIDAIIKKMDKPISDFKTTDYDNLLAHYLKAGKDEQSRFKNNKNDEALIYGTLTSLRQFSIWAYKTSENVGENVLAYDPVPGKLIGCMSLEEATGGKAWSL